MADASIDMDRQYFESATRDGGNVDITDSNRDESLTDNRTAGGASQLRSTATRLESSLRSSNSNNHIKRTRSRSRYSGESSMATQGNAVSVPSGAGTASFHPFPWGWNEGDFLQAAMLQSISPACLRPTPMLNHRGGRTGHQGEAASGADVDANGNTNGSGNSQVKFVNSTMEILQNQMKKEDIPKKRRTRTTPDQLRILQKAFTTDPMPNSTARLALAKKLGMNARAVQVWFQNRRAKEKLEAKRSETSYSRDRNSPFSPSGHSHQHVESPQFDGGNPVSPSLGAFISGTPKNRGMSVIPPHPSMHQSHPHHTHRQSQAQHPQAAALYDLGMYFDDQESYAQALAQYASNLDLSAYSFCNENDSNAISNVTGGNLLDELESSDGGPNFGNYTENSDAGQLFQRFQSMPSTNMAYSHDFNNNALGIVFPMDGEEIRDVSPTSRSHSIAASLDDVNMNDLGNDREHSRIFAKPASREAFLTAPLGQGVPMPGMKQRSASVPEISSQIRNTLFQMDEMRHGNDLLAIREEDVIAHPNDGVNPPGSFNKQHKMYHSMLVGGDMDELQTYLDGINNGVASSRYD